MTPEQLEEIEARARGATTERGGDWFAFQCQYRWHGSKPIFEDGTWFIQWSSEPETMPVATVDFGDDHDEPTRESACHIANHIAGMDPATTLALTAALRQAWEENERLREALPETFAGWVWTEEETKQLREKYDHALAHKGDTEFLYAMAAEGIRIARARALKEPTHDQD